METPARPTPTVQIGGVKLTGAPAVAALLSFLVLIVALIFYWRPSLSNWPSWVSAALWISFITYWGQKAKGAAPTRSSESVKSRAVHTNLMNLSFLLLFVPVPGLRQPLLPDSAITIAAGLAIQSASFMLAVWARQHLGRNWSGAITVAVDHELVQSGPYRFVRHPIYTAMLGMFLGAAIASNTVHALCAVIVISLAYVRKVRLEEANLRNVFGAKYDAYRRKSWAIIPGLL